MLTFVQHPFEFPAPVSILALEPPLLSESQKRSTGTSKRCRRQQLHSESRGGSKGNKKILVSMIWNYAEHLFNHSQIYFRALWYRNTEGLEGNEVAMRQFSRCLENTLPSQRSCCGQTEGACQKIYRMGAKALG